MFPVWLANRVEENVDAPSVEMLPLLPFIKCKCFLCTYILVHMNKYGNLFIFAFSFAIQNLQFSPEWILLYKMHLEINVSFSFSQFEKEDEIDFLIYSFCPSLSTHTYIYIYICIYSYVFMYVHLCKWYNCPWVLFYISTKPFLKLCPFHLFLRLYKWAAGIHSLPDWGTTWSKFLLPTLDLQLYLSWSEIANNFLFALYIVVSFPFIIIPSWILMNIYSIFHYLVYNQSDSTFGRWTLRHVKMQSLCKQWKTSFPLKCLFQMLSETEEQNKRILIPWWYNT